jgi:serine protease AprX
LAKKIDFVTKIWSKENRGNLRSGREPPNQQRPAPNQNQPMKTRSSKPAALRRVFSIILFCLAALAAIFAIAPSRAVNPTHSGQALVVSKIAPWVIDHTADGKQAEFLVVLADQADFSAAYSLTTKLEKGRYVRDVLWNKAQATQGPIIELLKQRGVEYRSFYVVNMLWVKGNFGLALDLATRPDVARIEGNPVIHNVENPLPVTRITNQPDVPNTVEPGVNYVNAPSVWALGYTGQGAVVGAADTGQRWTHNALKPHYRGWNGVVGNHDYNWHDSIHPPATGGSCGTDSLQPCDDNGHGTHTIGTAVGDDGSGNQIGVAPGAKWIGCRNMDQGNGTPARYTECMEFFLAPYPVGGTPQQGNPALAPDITTNSWVCPSSEGCAPGTLQQAVEGQLAAGINMVVGAGNDGSACSSVFYPPAIYEASYTVGALNTGTDNLASFSSRGPVTIDSSNRIKPNITTPGTNTRSSYNSSDSAYANLSGTSMATPHAAGVTALLISARSYLRQNPIAERTILNNSAVHINSSLCSSNGTWPNNLFGNGRINALAAYNYVAILSGVSRKTHGGAGTFDVPLTLSGEPAVECRDTAGNHTVVFTFNNNLQSGNAIVTGGVGTVSGAPVIAGSTMTVNLTAVADAQRLTLTLQSVTDTNSEVLPDTAIRINFLAGDVNANKSVNAADVAAAKAQLGQPVGAGNFRADYNANGTLNAADIAGIKGNLGHGVP